MIPTIIHQIWFQGYNNIPNHLYQYHKSWVNNNKNYTFIIWDEQSIQKLVDNCGIDWIITLFNSYKKMIQKIDFAKYLILYTYGGIYIDMDIKCLKQLSLLPYIKIYDCIFSLPPYDPVQHMLLTLVNYSNNNKQLINNGIMFCIKQHEIMLMTMEEANKNKDSIYNNISNSAHVFITTGPLCLTNAVNRYIDKYGVDKIKILDNTYFEPCDINTVDNGCVIPTNSIGVHVYEGSWLSNIEKNCVYIYYYTYNNSDIIILIIIIFIVLFYKYIYYEL